MGTRCPATFIKKKDAFGENTQSKTHPHTNYLLTISFIYAFISRTQQRVEKLGPKRQSNDPRKWVLPEKMGNAFNCPKLLDNCMWQCNPSSHSSEVGCYQLTSQSTGILTFKDDQKFKKPQHLRFLII